MWVWETKLWPLSLSMCPESSRRFPARRSWSRRWCGWRNISPHLALLWFSATMTCFARTSFTTAKRVGTLSLKLASHIGHPQDGMVSLCALVLTPLHYSFKSVVFYYHYLFICWLFFWLIIWRLVWNCQRKMPSGPSYTETNCIVVNLVLLQDASA